MSSRHLVSSIEELAKYPTIIGLAELRETIARWVEQRFGTRALDPSSEVLPVNGTREGLFAIAQALVTPGREGAVVIPNPFYQIYEGAALLAGVQPTLDRVRPFDWLFSELPKPFGRRLGSLSNAFPLHPGKSVREPSFLRASFTG